MENIWAQKCNWLIDGLLPAKLMSSDDNWVFKTTCFVTTLFLSALEDLLLLCARLPNFPADARHHFHRSRCQSKHSYSLRSIAQAETGLKTTGSRPSHRDLLAAIN